MAQTINIMHVVRSLECGGLEAMVIDFAAHSNRAGLESAICCLDNLGILARQAMAKRTNNRRN